MNVTVKSLFAVLAIGGSALFATAQTPKILVVDMAQLYDNHYKTEEQNVKLSGDQQKATEELERLNSEGNRLVEQFRELDEQAKNPALSDAAKQKAVQDAQQKLEEIQRKNNEVQSFRANTERTLRQRMQTFRDILLEEISKVAVEVAKRQGATLLVDKSGPTLIGIAPVIYADASVDITAAVAAEINKGRPASATDAGTPKASDEPAISFPGAKKN
jgi:outer membrane protein